jgi:hypothetical protein
MRRVQGVKSVGEPILTNGMGMRAGEGAGALIFEFKSRREIRELEDLACALQAENKRLAEFARKTADEIIQLRSFLDDTA